MIVDTNLFFQIFSLHNQFPWLTPIMVIVTKYLNYLSFLIGTIIAYKAGTKERKAWVLMVGGLILIYPVIQLIRLFIQEPRPFLTFHLTPLITPPADLSFPSGHASFMGVIAAAFLITRSKWSWLFIFLALLVGFSRIYVGVHYPLDVLTGFVLGFLIVWGVKYLLKIVYHRFLRV